MRRKLGAARDGGCDGMDVPGWAVEVKRTEVLTLPPFWAQAKRQAEQFGRRPVLFWRKSRAKWVAFMDPHDLAPEIFQPGAIRCRCRCLGGARWRGLGLENYQIWKSAA